MGAGIAPSVPSIVAEGLTRRFGGVIALADVSFRIASGQILGILGPNGAGKSTLINVVSGLIPATAGSVRIAGEPVDGLSLAARARKGLLRSFQNTRPSDELTAAELLRSAEIAPHRPSAWSGERLLALFGLSAYADEALSALPYGVQKMVGLAAVALCQPRVLFLDEPFQGVADTDIDRLGDVIRHFQAEGVAIGLVEHNVPSVLALCAEVIVLDSGRMIYQGPAEGALGDPVVRSAYLGLQFAAAG